MTLASRATLVVLAGLLAAGCVSKSQFLSKSQEVDRLTADLVRERQRSGEMALRAAQLEARLTETTERLAAATEERDRLRGELTEARTEAARLSGQLAEATGQRDTLARQLDIAHQSLSQRDVNLQQLTYRYDDLVKDLERQKSELGRRVTDLGTQLAAAESRVSALQAERDALSAERLRLETRLREADADLTTTRQRLGAAEAELATTRDRLAGVEAELGTTRERLGTAEAELAATRERLGETQAELAARERKLAETTATYDQLVSDLKGEIAEGQVKITRLRDRLTVNLVDKILFDSGSTAINPKGQEVLKKVAEVLRPITDKRIQIEGHTDNVPISPSLKARFPTNWELSVARATVVARFLQDQGGLDPVRLVATGYGEYHPVASNETPDGRAQNRRIEIVLVPDTTETALR